jgi:hypothetical protein
MQAVVQNATRWDHAVPLEYESIAFQFRIAASLWYLPSV